MQLPQLPSWFSRRDALTLFFLLLLILALPLGLWEIQRQKDLRSRAESGGYVLINDGASLAPQTNTRMVMIKAQAPWPLPPKPPISPPVSVPVSAPVFSSASVLGIAYAQGSLSCSIWSNAVDPSGKDGCSAGQYCVQHGVSVDGSPTWPVQQRWPWGWNNSNQETFRGYNYGSGSDSFQVEVVENNGNGPKSAKCSTSISVPAPSYQTPSTQDTYQTPSTTPASGGSSGTCTISSDLVDSNSRAECKGKAFCVRYWLDPKGLENTDDYYVQWSFGNGVDFNGLSDAKPGNTYRPYNSQCTGSYVVRATVHERAGSNRQVRECTKGDVNLCKASTQPGTASPTPYATPAYSTPAYETPSGPTPTAVPTPAPTPAPTPTPTPPGPPRFVKDFRIANSAEELLTANWSSVTGDPMVFSYELPPGLGEKIIAVQFRDTQDQASQIYSSSITVTNFEGRKSVVLQSRTPGLPDARAEVLIIARFVGQAIALTSIEASFAGSVQGLLPNEDYFLMWCDRVGIFESGCSGLQGTIHTDPNGRADFGGQRFFYSVINETVNRSLGVLALYQWKLVTEESLCNRNAGTQTLPCLSGDVSLLDIFLPATAPPVTTPPYTTPTGSTPSAYPTPSYSTPTSIYQTPSGTVPVSPSRVRGDVNGDGVVNVLDYSALLASWNASTLQAGSDADLNGDGKVNTIDLAILLSVLEGGGG
ncbi:MAG: dockerin type I repeat-containing protein [bacterium]|nr:dockerin type I repeat-containing protein [bacterium]